MQKYNWLLRKQAKAMNVFIEAGEQLKAVKAHLLKEISANHAEMGELFGEIREREGEIEFLKKQHAEVNAQHEKLLTIAGPKDGK